MVYASSGCAVPDAHIVTAQRVKRSANRAQRSGGEILLIHVPEIAHGRMAVADMAGIGACEHTLRRTRFMADNEVVVLKRELLDGHGKEWHQ